MINARVRTIARNNKLRVCNLASLPNSILSPDLIHPNDAGYRRMAAFFYNWFIKVYPIDPIVSPE
jgi:lysophospholipase L1-like esterase